MKLFILVWVTLGALWLQGCGDSRTSAHLRSAEEIKAITDTFSPGQTTISDVLAALGLWNSQTQVGNDNEVSYWTNDGGTTSINFTIVCDPSYPNCLSGGVYNGDPAYSRYTTTVHRAN